MDFKNQIIGWYLRNKRDLPWRNTANPYLIWVSEIILQQTRVAQGLGYYQRFIEKFPTVISLAESDEDEVLKVWQGLGYYTRARNLHQAAKVIVSDFNGKLPSDYNDLLNIKGIGSYSAGAIASFAFKKPVPAIDGNVYRIISRIFGVFASPFTTSGKIQFFELVLDLMDKKQPDVFNQALLDFGALQCIPKSPNCPHCIFSEQCYAFRNNIVDSLPVRAKKRAPRIRFFTYLLVRVGKFTFISKRKQKDIWRSLYEFPLIESKSLCEINQLTETRQWRQIFKGVSPSMQYVSPTVKHLLSHQTIITRFVVVEIPTVTNLLINDFLMIPVESISDYSVPKLIDNFLAAEPAAQYFINPTE